MDDTGRAALQDTVEAIAIAPASDIDTLLTRSTQQNTSVAPEVAFSARETDLQSGDSTLLTWNAEHADSCTATGAGVG